MGAYDRGVQAAAAQRAAAPPGKRATTSPLNSSWTRRGCPSSHGCRPCQRRPLHQGPRNDRPADPLVHRQSLPGAVNHIGWRRLGRPCLAQDAAGRAARSIGRAGHHPHNYPGQAPRIVENQVTYTLTTTMLAGDIVAQEISRCITVPNLALYDLAMGGATRASSYVLRAGRLKHALSASEQKPPEQCAETCWPIAEGTPIGSEICMRLTSGQFKSVPVKTVMLRSAARGRQISRLISVVQKRLHLLNSQPGVQCSRRSS